jgi:heptosyltransferase-2
MTPPKKFLVIQTAFLGDVVLSTSILEKLHQYYPDAQIDILVRRGNEGLFEYHPFLHGVYVWDKKNDRYNSLRLIIKQIRQQKYDYAINLQRFFSSGLITFSSGAKNKRGFTKNPLSFLFDKSVEHTYQGQHEIDRNQLLIDDITDNFASKPKLYTSKSIVESINQYIHNQRFITIAPASVWFTKQFPFDKWVDFINHIPDNITIYLLGGPNDVELCTFINKISSREVIILAGKLSYLQVCALINKALMNYTNDSAPLHLASAMNAPTASIFCSTVPEYGFTPLSDNHTVIEIQTPLPCRPCGLHGRKSCPLHHFNCANLIQTKQLTEIIL